MPFHFCGLSLNSINNFLLYVPKKSFTSLVKFTPKYFVLFVPIVNGIVFAISFSDSSLLVYGNTTSFCNIDFLPCNFAEFISYNNKIFVEFLGFPIYMIMSPANRCLIALARTSSPMLITSGESGHPCLILDLGGKTFRFPLLIGMLAV
jgi:hypothetical protein